MIFDIHNPLCLASAINKVGLGIAGRSDATENPPLGFLRVDEGKGLATRHVATERSNLGHRVNRQVAPLAFVPFTTAAMKIRRIQIALSTNNDPSVMKPIAAPIVGGMITSTIHVLILVPVVKKLERGERR